MVEKNNRQGDTEMLLCKVKSLLEYWKLKRIAKQVRAGKVPKGVSKERIFEALRVTRPNAVEMFGFLEAKIWNPDGSLKRDVGLVSCRKITAAFAKVLVDGFADSAVAADLDHFAYHKMGAGSTAETDTETALVTQQVGATLGTQTHGTSSQIYQTVGTITAGSSFGCREHGIFNASTGGTMLDRSVVTNIDLNTDDIVTWTYSLTVNAGG